MPSPAFARPVLAPRTRLIGHLHPATTLLDRLTFPVIAELQAVGYMTEALGLAASHRAGVVVVGPKGAGKSLGLERAVADFEDAEARRHALDETYARRGVRLVQPLRVDDRTGFVRALYAEEMGALPPRLARGGDEVLLLDLVAAWRDEGVAVVVFDEAEMLGAGALDGCRDILAKSAAPRSRLSGTRDRFGASGIGVVLSGTPDLLDRLRRSPEYGERWTSEIVIDGLPASALPEVYRRYLPAFAREAEARGDAAWARYVIDTCAAHLGGSLRRLEHHVRAFVTDAVNSAAVPPASLDDIGFDEAMFAATLHALPR